MATYAIGDVQGCFRSLQQLIKQIDFNPQVDRLWFVGDLVNRGPDSAGVLRYVKALGSAAYTVLGNHELFLLAAAEQVVTLRPKDTIHDILQAEDRTELLNWLLHQPLHHREGSFLMVHAGLLPQWTIDEAVQLACEVRTVLTGPDRLSFLQQLFHDPTTRWNPSLTRLERLASVARVLTRLRTCTSAGEMSNFSGPPDQVPVGFAPWFRIPERRNTGAVIITGHWAALGLHMEPNVLAIDSGCVWGRQLTTVRLDDRAVFQVDCAERPCYG